jgi:hypothetical protein
LQQDTEIVDQRVKLKPQLVLYNALAGQARSVDHLFALRTVAAPSDRRDAAKPYSARAFKVRLHKSGVHPVV